MQTRTHSFVHQAGLIALGSAFTLAIVFALWPLRRADEAPLSVAPPSAAPYARGMTPPRALTLGEERARAAEERGTPVEGEREPPAPIEIERVQIAPVEDAVDAGADDGEGEGDAPPDGLPPDSGVNPATTTAETSETTEEIGELDGGIIIRSITTDELGLRSDPRQSQDPPSLLATERVRAALADDDDISEQSRRGVVATTLERVVTLQGEVPSERDRAVVQSHVEELLGPSYTINNMLIVRER